ncbi:unnamed protein product, partial [Rangifer tarandus platyrhynchus]
MNRSLRVSKAHRPRFQTVGLHAVSEELNSTYVQFRKSCTAPAETFTSDVDPNTLHVTAPPTARHSASTLAGDGLRWNKTRDIITHETRVPRSQRTACSVREVRLQWCMCLTQHELAVQKKTVVTHYTTMTENGCTRESFESGEKHEGSVYIESKAGWKRHTYRARRPRKVLRLHKRRGPDITSAVIYYLKQTGDTCTKKRLALSVVGEDSAYTRVKSVLRKLSHVFNVAKTQKLILSSSGGWQLLLKPDPSQESLPRGLDALGDDAIIRDLRTSALFVGKSHSVFVPLRFAVFVNVKHMSILTGSGCVTLQPRGRGTNYTCADVSLDDASLAALPVATKAALPAVIMVADKTTKQAGNDGRKPEIITRLAAVVDLLAAMVPATSRLYLTRSSAAGKPDPDAPEQIQLQREDEFQRLHPDNVYLHSQDQLDLIFPGGMYHPVFVVDSETRSIEVGSRAVHAYPTWSSSYVCTGRRRVRLVESSWEALRKREISEPRSLLAPSHGWKLLAKLLVARAGSQTEQQPQVVLLRLFREKDKNQEHWQEELLGWIEETSPLFVSCSACVPANVHEFRQILAADADTANNLIRLRTEAPLKHVLADKMIQLYNINKEELYSMWDEATEHSAVDPHTMEGVFTRPINVPVFRPIDPRDVLVSPADSVVQQLYRLTPDKYREIRDVRIPN